jgi:uncharacterized protein YkwD
MASMQLSSQIRIVLGAVALAFALAPAAASETTTLNTSERSLLAAVNDARVAHDLRPLQVDPTLVRAARDHSASLLRDDVFTHGAFVARLARHGARGPAFGENLAWGTGSFASARSIVRSWLESPGHRANLLRPGWSRIGIGTRVGSFLGYDGATVVTADFAG